MSRNAKHRFVAVAVFLIVMSPSAFSLEKSANLSVSQLKKSLEAAACQRVVLTESILYHYDFALAANLEIKLNLHEPSLSKVILQQDGKTTESSLRDFVSTEIDKRLNVDVLSLLRSDMPIEDILVLLGSDFKKSGSGDLIYTWKAAGDVAISMSDIAKKSKALEKNAITIVDSKGNVSICSLKDLNKSQSADK